MIFEFLNFQNSQNIFKAARNLSKLINDIYETFVLVQGSSWFHVKAYKKLFIFLDLMFKTILSNFLFKI